MTPPASAGATRDIGLIPGLGRSPEEGNGSPLHCSCLDRGAWQARDRGLIPGWDDPLKEEMPNHSIVLAVNRGPWQATVHGVRHD